MVQYEERRGSGFRVQGLGTSSIIMAEYEERRGSSMASRRRMPSVMNLMRVLSLTT